MCQFYFGRTCSYVSHTDKSVIDKKCDNNIILPENKKIINNNHK